MSNVEAAIQPANSRLRFLFETTWRNRASVAWLVSAAVLMFAAFAFTTIRVRDSILDVTQLQLLVAALLSVAATSVLIAFKVRSERWHAASWIVVSGALFSCIFLT
ncbi:MAG: hypothetical protein GY903_32055 [Fuerstiella sp.]|nr:hypothetical protein [Fuerstiella sp.]MCP4859126.1 hypothetical protein [Fuerstiella sp.]